MTTPFDISALSLDTLSQAKGWQARYKLLLSWSKHLPEQTDIRTADYEVKGCESATWLQHIDDDGVHYFVIDSDSRVVKGLAVVLLLMINEQTADTILSNTVEQTFIDLGFEKHLSPSRSNGFKAMLEKARSYCQ